MENIHGELNNYGRQRKVINLSTEEIFNSVMDASRKYGICYKNIIGACKGTQKTSGGFKWEYYI
jgi:hypothetical protein